MGTGGDFVYDLVVLNSEATDIPPFGCMVIVDADKDEGELVINVRRPTTADVKRSDPNCFLFNLGEWIPGNKHGRATPVVPCYALVDEATGVTTDEYKSFVGPVANSYNLGKGVIWQLQVFEETDPHTVGQVKVYRIDYIRTRVLVGVCNGILTTGATPFEGTFNPYTNVSGSWVTSAVALPCRTVVSAIAATSVVEAKIVNGVWFVVRLC